LGPRTDSLSHRNSQLGGSCRTCGGAMIGILDVRSETGSIWLLPERCNLPARRREVVDPSPLMSTCG